MSNNICFYHKDCLDGLVSAMYYKRDFTDAELHPVQYGDVPPVETYEGKSVAIVDFSFKDVEVFNSILDKATHVTWLDHHRSAIEWYIENIDKIENKHKLFSMLDESRSGAWLTYGFLYPNTHTPLLVKYVSDYDTWQHNLPNVKEVFAWLASQPFTIERFEEIDKSFRTDPSFFDKVVFAGSALLSALDNNMQWAMQFTHTVVLGDVELFAVNGHRATISLIGERLAMQNGGLALVYYVEGERVKCSLRGNNKGQCLYKVTAKEIAERYGGGGQTNAASFYMPLKEFAQCVKGL